MKMHEFGRDNTKTILLLHGAGCTYKMWTPQIKDLEKEYHLFVPSISGHERDDIDFESSEIEAEIILNWFYKHNMEQIDVICGASLGAHVAAAMIQKNSTFAKQAFIESLKGYEFSGVTLRIFCAMGAFIMRKCANAKGYMAGCYNQKYASDDCKSTIQNMSSKTLNHIMLETAHYLIPNCTNKIQTKTLILYGEKEKNLCKKNSELLQNQIAECSIIEIPDYHHGELSIGNSSKHLKMLQDFI